MELKENYSPRTQHRILKQQIHPRLAFREAGKEVADWLRACFCPCGFVPGLAGLADLPDILGLAAPKPVAVLIGRKDRGFPADSVHRAFDRLQEIYAAADAPQNCQLYMGEEGHRFYAQDAWAFIREFALKRISA